LAFYLGNRSRAHEPAKPAKAETIAEAEEPAKPEDDELPAPGPAGRLANAGAADLKSVYFGLDINNLNTVPYFSTFYPLNRPLSVPCHPVRHAIKDL
jgi:hypothetical protein